MGCPVDWEDDGSGADAGMVLNREVSGGEARGVAAKVMGSRSAGGPRGGAGGPMSGRVSWDPAVVGHGERRGAGRSTKPLRQRIGRGRVYQRASSQECVVGVAKQ